MPPSQTPPPPEPPSSTPDSDDYSAASTLTRFPLHLPLLRGPIKDYDPTSDPSLSPYLLAFVSPLKWARAHKYCENQLTAQCLSGARIGCSLAASEKCKPPWWKLFLGVTSNDDFKEREKCEEVEMKSCLDLAEARCGEFVKKRCGDVFGKANVCVVSRKGISKLISNACFGDKRSFGVRVWGLDENPGAIVKVVTGSNLVGNGDDLDADDWLEKGWDSCRAENQSRLN